MNYMNLQVNDITPIEMNYMNLQVNDITPIEMNYMNLQVNDITPTIQASATWQIKVAKNYHAHLVINQFYLAL